MRDPNRIDAFLSRLGDVWRQVPDWRFGQLMCNTLGYAGPDPFYTEDDTLIDVIEKVVAGQRPGQIANNHIEEVLSSDLPRAVRRETPGD